MVLNYFNRIYEIFLFAVILINIYQRKLVHTESKRRAPILIAVDFLAVYFLLVLRTGSSLPAWVDWFIIAFGFIIAIVLRKYFWPFRFHCQDCGRRLDIAHIIGGDENLCKDCFKKRFPDEARTMERKTMNEDEKFELMCIEANKVDQVPWGKWEPTENCVLTYLISDEKVLLIEKKKGMGTGYYNAPGGHIELEETMLEAAIRETKEETGLDVSDLEERGTLYFQFKDGIRMTGHVFFAHSYTGELIDECDETRPFWCDIDKLDYSMMWEDDRMWLPLALQGKHFEGYFIFDDRKLLDSKIVEITDNED